MSTSYEESLQQTKVPEPNWDDALQQAQIIKGEKDPVLDVRCVAEARELRLRLAKSPDGGRRSCFKIRCRLSSPANMRFLKRKNAEGYAIFFTLNRSDGAGVKKQNIISAEALALDMDGAPLPKTFDVPPHLIVNTSPKKYQCFWAMNPSTDFDECEDTARRLAGYYGGDPTVCDIAHVFRLAGFLHWKSGPYRSRIFRMNEFEPLVSFNSFSFLPPSSVTNKSTNSWPGTIDAEKAKLLFSNLPVEHFCR